MPGLPSKVHIMGIGGTAMAGIAGLFRELGCEVRGSDAADPYPPMGTLLKEMGIPVMAPYAPENLQWGPQLVVVGNVIRRTNPEAIALLEKGLPYCSMPQALHEHFLKNKRTIVVAGTHGKTTTTSLLSHLLCAHGLEPGVLVGGVSVNLGRNFRLGKGDFFVVEGDEYDTAFFDKRPKFLHYAPSAAIILNIEYDHADIFPNLDAVVSAFAAFAALLPENAPLLVPEGSSTCEMAVKQSKARVVTFGIARGEWQASGLSFCDGCVRFEMSHNGRVIGEFTLPLIGKHNVFNAVAALALLYELGLPIHPSALASFRGVKKRQELVGEINGVRVYDDFAHHPTAVRETIDAFRRAFPGARLIVLFEPESNTSRRRVFQQEYAQAFSQADEVLFFRPLEKPDNLAPEERIDMQRLCQDIGKQGVPARMIGDVEELAFEAASVAHPGDIIVAMSGRDFCGVHRLILERLAQRA